MAIKAGLVGVNPKGVDHNGMPIASGGSGSGVSEAQLTANGKQFFFAYDETSEQYGYKLDGAGDFIPFEGAGGDGWVAPADSITTGLGYTNLDYVEGGYKTENGICILDITVLHTNTTIVSYLTGLPRSKNSSEVILLKAANDLEGARGYVDAVNPTTVTHATQTITDYIQVDATGYVHYWGMYEIATE